MARPRKKPDYDPDKIMNSMLDAVVDLYKQTMKTFDRKGEIKMIADELEIAPHKARKLLITAGIRDKKNYYYNPTGEKVQKLYMQGCTVTEIMEIMGLNRTSVCCYLPYSKGVYNAKELSLDAERLRRFRDRQQRCERFMTEISVMSDANAEEYLWDTLSFLAGCIFWTAGRGGKGSVRYKYEIRGGEMFVTSKKKSITKSTVILAFNNAMEIQAKQGYVSGPKALGTFGASYLYPIFLRLGVCTSAKEEVMAT